MNTLIHVVVPLTFSMILTIFIYLGKIKIFFQFLLCLIIWWTCGKKLFYTFIRHTTNVPFLSYDLVMVISTDQKLFIFSLPKVVTVADWDDSFTDCDCL